MSKPIVMVIDDDPAILKVLNYSLSAENYQVRLANDAEQGLASIKQEVPDMILLDWMMPGLDGLDMMRYLRKHKATRDVPIIMLTARAAEDDQVKGLLEGADDYITKPFSVREMNARIHSLLRRKRPHRAQGNVVWGEIELNPDERRVRVRGNEVPMTSTEFKMLHFFITHPNRVYSRAQILDHVWGVNKFVNERTVDVHILRLRKTLQANKLGRVIQTVRGLGYRLDDSVEDD